MQGTLLNQRYRLTKVLGAGGFGQTYLANDTHYPSSPPCVVKQFKPVSNDTKFLEVARRLFDTEAKILEKLGQHALIPTFIDFFEEGEEFYLVQEFIDGISMSDALLGGLQFNEQEAIDFLKDVLSILDFIHRNDVIHRDVKPENLIKRHSDERYVLIDFGAVKEKQFELAGQTRLTNIEQGNTRSISTRLENTISTNTRPTNIEQLSDGPQSSLTVGIGTEGYTPHEQLKGRPLHSSDLYALGITTIQALTGMQPYEWGDDPDTGELQWQPYALTSVGFTLILETMVRFNVKHRYARANDVLSDLQKLASLPEEYTTIPEDDLNRFREKGDGVDSHQNTGLLAYKIKPPGPRKKSRWHQLKPLAIIGTATVVMSGLVLGARQLGWLQPLELATYDRLVQLHSNFGIDSRLLVVEITEQDLQTLKRPTPSDADLTKVLRTLEAYHPRVIGVDLHRELRQGPPEQHEQLIEQINASNAIAITFLGDGDDHIPPPEDVPPQQIGFNDLSTDLDGVLRRNVLIGGDADNRRVDSFAFLMATRYLEKNNIIPEADPQDISQMRLGKASLPRLDKNAGLYQDLDNGGYQIMLDYRSGGQAVQRVTFTDVIEGNISPESVTDNVVVIGTTATSSRDRFLTPYSTNQASQSSDEKMPGVIIHAQMISQLLDVAFGVRVPRWYWADEVEILWIVGWAIAGSALAYYCRHPIVLGGGGVVLVLVVSGVSFYLFDQGGWIPTLTPCVAALLTGGATVTCRAYLTQRKQELLSDFLSRSHLKHSLTQDDPDLPIS